MYVQQKNGLCQERDKSSKGIYQVHNLYMTLFPPVGIVGKPFQAQTTRFVIVHPNGWNMLQKVSEESVALSTRFLIDCLRLLRSQNFLEKVYRIF